MCYVCRSLLDDAVQVPCCGAVCCRVCIEQWLLRHAQKQCVKCRQSIKAHDLQRYVLCDVWHMLCDL